MLVPCSAACAWDPGEDCQFWLVIPLGHRYLQVVLLIVGGKLDEKKFVPFSSSILSRREFLYLNMRHSSAALR